MSTTPIPTPIPHGATIDEILHGLVILGITAASIFVKNPTSRDHASSIINAVNTTVLPIADGILNPPKAP